VVGAGNGLTPKSIHLTLKGLAHHTTYHVHVVASNSAGAAKSKSKSVHTK
jgi:hypothetical protein